MMTAARGLAQVASGGRPVSNMSPELIRLAGDTFGIPIPVLILAGVSLAAWALLANTRLGRYVYAVGGNESAARAAAQPATRRPRRSPATTSPASPNQHELERAERELEEAGI